MIFLGIDPGLDGAVAAIDADTGFARVAVLPTLKISRTRRGRKKARVERDLDVPALRTLLTGWAPFSAIRLAVLEEVHARPGQGVCSMFTFGGVYHSLRNLLRWEGVPLEVIVPQVWKAEIFAGAEQDKRAAVAFCRARFPEVSLRKSSRSRTDHDGMAEALCLAEFARRRS